MIEVQRADIKGYKEQTIIATTPDTGAIEGEYNTQNIKPATWIQCWVR